MVTIKIRKEDLDFIEPSEQVPKYPFNNSIVDFSDCNNYIISVSDCPEGGMYGIITTLEFDIMFAFIEKDDGTITHTTGAKIDMEDFYKNKVPIAIEAMKMVHGVMDYIVTYQPQDISVAKKKAKKKNKKGKKVNHKGGEPHVIYLKRHIKSSICGHTNHSQPDHQVEVRGFFRHYKSGKVVWVRPHIRYKDKKPVKMNNLFKLDFQ